MKHILPKVLLLFMVTSIVLGACMPSPTAPPAVPNQSEATVPTLGPVECKPGLDAIQPPTAEQAALVANIPPVNETDLVRGPADAAVTILEYSDYQ